MKKHSKIFFLFFIFIFLTTYNPKNLDSSTKTKKNDFFIIKNIEVSNNKLVSSEEVNLRLSLIYEKNIFLVKIADFENSLYKIDFIEKIELKKKYPDTIRVKIHEEKPIAILNKKRKKFFFCESSKLIPFNKNFNFNDLPSVFGEDSEIYLIDFIKLLRKNEFPINKIKDFYFFKIGRWDIRLENEQIIKLPFIQVEETIKQLIALLNRKEFQKYKVIDLRINDKIITE